MVFISYKRPMRSRRTLIHCAGTFAVGIVSAGFSAKAFYDSQGIPSVFAIVSGLVMIVACAICISLAWSILSGFVHEVEITETGIQYDGRHWSWDSVKSVHHRRPIGDGPEFLNVGVTTGTMRSPLSLLVEMQKTVEDDPVSRLKQFLKSTHPRISWT